MIKYTDYSGFGMPWSDLWEDEHVTLLRRTAAIGKNSVPPPEADWGIEVIRLGFFVEIRLIPFENWQKAANRL